MPHLAEGVDSTESATPNVLNMNAVVEFLDDVPVVLVPSATDESEVVYENSADGGLENTSGFDGLRRKLADLPKIAAALSADIGRLIKSNDDSAPSEIACELKLSLGQECKFWIIGLKGEQAVTLKFTWKK